MAKKNIWKRFVPIIMLLVFSAAVGVTGATVFHAVSLENPIKTPTVEGEIPEEIDGRAKNTQFRNNGEADVFLRVAYAESWTNTPEGRTLPLKGDTKDNSAPIRVAIPNWQTDGWVEGTDGWLYYTKVLKSGEITDEIVTDVGYIGTDDLNKLVEKEAYENGKYELHFTMETVQCSDDAGVSLDAIRENWGEAMVPSLPGHSGGTENTEWDKEGTITWPQTTPWEPEK